MSLWCLALVLCLIRIHGIDAVSLSYEGKLLRTIANTTTYETLARPVRNQSDAVIVRFETSLRHLVRFDDENERVSIHVLFNLFWEDHYLKWNSSDYGNLEVVYIDGMRVWRPDIALIGNLGGIYDVAEKAARTYFRVSSNGTVSWMTPRVFVTKCNLDITYFPFDIHNCTFSFRSRNYESEKLMCASYEKVDISGYQLTPDGLWILSDVTASTAIDHLNYSLYDLNFTFKRRPQYYIINIIAPCMFISLLVPLMFHLPVDTGEKMTLGVTILLAFSVFQLVIANSSPVTSDSIPLLSVFVFSLMIVSAFAIILTGFIIRLHHCHDVIMPRWLHVFIFSFMARLVCDCKRKTTTDDVERSYSARRRRSKVGGEYNDTLELTELRKKYESSDDRNRNRCLFYLDEILSLLREKNKYDREAADREFSKQQWRQAARILDSFFLRLYLAWNLVAFVTYMVVLPEFSVPL